MSIVLVFFPSEDLSHSVRVLKTKHLKIKTMKLNFKEIGKLPWQIQKAIYHLPNNTELQQAFPKCFEEDESGDGRVPWSYINKEGCIGKYSMGIHDGCSTQVADTIPIDTLTVSYEDNPDILVPKNDPFWPDNTTPADGRFKPYIWEHQNSMYLVVAIWDTFAHVIPLANIDFSK